MPFSVLGSGRRFDDFRSKSIAPKISIFPFWAQNGTAQVYHALRLDRAAGIKNAR